MIYEVGQVESLATVVANAANKVNRIEVCAILKGLNILGIVAVYLATFKNLQANRSVFVISKERSAARFAHILNHTTNTHGPVKFLVEVLGQCLIVEFAYTLALTTQFLFKEVHHFIKLFARASAFIKHRQIGERTLLQMHKNAAKQLFIGNGVVFKSIGHHVINVLNKHHVAFYIVQVLN